MFKSALFTAGLFAVSAVAQQILVNTPSNVVVCRPVQITWTGGTPPYELSLIAQGTTQPAIESYTVTSSPFIYTTHLAVGTNVFVNLADSLGQVGQTAPFPVLTGSDTSCIGQPYSSASGTPASTGAGTTAPGTTAPGTTAPGTTAPGTTAPGTTAPGTTSSGTSAPTTRTTGSSTSAPASTSSGNSAPTQAAIGFAGIVGAAVMAVLA